MVFFFMEVEIPTQLLWDYPSTPAKVKRFQLNLTVRTSISYLLYAFSIRLKTACNKIDESLIFGELDISAGTHAYVHATVQK